ncbi:MAG: response regulator [Lacisediminihabitans sp.]
MTEDRVKVLIVDDSDDQRDLLRRHFELAGCDVTVAESAESAILAYEAAAPDLAVIDLILPGMNGWALTERIQADHPDCAVAITSVLDEEDYPPSEAVLPKPVTRANVRQVLRHCVPRWIAP